MPYVVILCYSFAYPRVATPHITIPLLGVTQPLITTPLQFVASLGNTSRYLSRTLHRTTLPQHYYTKRHNTFAVQHMSCRYLAPPYHRITILHCAIPSPNITQRNPAILYLCASKHRRTKHSCAIPLQNIAPRNLSSQNHTVAYSSISSQTKRPLPLLRH